MRNTVTILSETCQLDKDNNISVNYDNVPVSKVSNSILQDISLLNTKSNLSASEIICQFEPLVSLLSKQLPAFEKDKLLVRFNLLKSKVQYLGYSAFKEFEYELQEG